MKSYFHTLVFLLVVVYSSPALSAPCDGSPPKIERLDLKQIAPMLDAKADEINAWWTQGRDNLELSDAIKERQSRIDQVYAKLAQDRVALYSTLTCDFVSNKRCCSTPGNRRQCPITEEPPSANVRFENLTVNGDDFDQIPSLSDRSVSYVVKKTGRGCNSGGFSAKVVYLDGAINKFAEEDVELVRAYFQSKVALSNPINTVLSYPSPQDSKCYNIVTELISLNDLRKSNAISEDEFQEAKAALLKACTK